MTLEEAKELFPEVTKKRPKSAIGYIYVTYEHISHKFYIGKQTKTYWSESYYGGGHYPQQWKRDNLPMSHWPIQWCYSKEELAKAEFNWIDRYKEHPDITNLTAGGRGGKGGGWAKPISDELHQIFSEIRMGADNPFFGKNHTEESKQKMSRSIKKYFETHENPRKNTKASEESKEKMRKSSALRWANPESKYQYANKILCVETGEVFNSLADASKAVGGNISNISAVCRGYKGRKTVCGYHWRFLEKDVASNVKIKHNTNKVKIICIETGEVFDSISDAGRAYGASRKNISKACKGEINSCLGYHWRYYDEEVTSEWEG